MRQFKFILIATVVAFFLEGCSVVNEYTDSYKFKYQHSTAVTDFSKITDILITKLEPTINKLPKQTPIYVIDFTNLQYLENFSELGFLLSSEIKTHVTQKYNLRVKQIEYMKYLKIGKSGTKLFSREVKDLKTTNLLDCTYALVGTYAFTQRQLILYLNLVELRTGVILKSATYATEQTDEIIHLEQKSRQINQNTIYQPLVL